MDSKIIVDEQFKSIINQYLDEKESARLVDTLKNKDDKTVLIFQGESATGKSTLARLIKGVFPELNTETFEITQTSVQNDLVQEDFMILRVNSCNSRQTYREWFGNWCGDHTLKIFTFPNKFTYDGTSYLLKYMKELSG